MLHLERTISNVIYLEEIATQIICSVTENEEVEDEVDYNRITLFEKQMRGCEIFNEFIREAKEGDDTSVGEDSEGPGEDEPAFPLRRKGKYEDFQKDESLPQAKGSFPGPEEKQPLRKEGGRESLRDGVGQSSGGAKRQELRRRDKKSQSYLKGKTVVSESSDSV